jgi:uncharacterized membrane protein
MSSSRNTDKRDLFYLHPLGWLRRRFLSGVAVTVPIILTVIVLSAILSFFDEWIQPAIVAIIGTRIPGLGLIFTILVIFSAGVLTRNILGRRLIDFWEGLLLRIPVVKNVYGAIRQVFTTFGSNQKTSFKQVVFIEYPGPGIWSIGFENARTRNEQSGEVWVHVFVMTAINPAGGFLVFLPEHKVRVTNISVESAIKLIVSGGIIIPEQWSGKALEKIKLDRGQDTLFV